MTVYNINLEVNEFERKFTEGYLGEPEEYKEDTVNINIYRKNNGEFELIKTINKKPFYNKAVIKDIVNSMDISSPC